MVLLINLIFMLFLIIVILFLPIIVFGLILFMRSSKELQYVQQNRDNLPNEKTFVAIMIVRKYPEDNFRLFTQGIDYLLKYFKATDQSYKVFLWPTLEQFKKTVRNVNANKMYIFGHGKINGICFQDEFLNYSQFKGCPKKEFIAQYHCNHGTGKSLADYLEATDKDVTSWYRFNPINFLYFFMKYHFSKK